MQKATDNIIEVSHLQKTFGELHAVNDISFTVERGEIFGFLGVNGAGKSTTINMLCTLLKPTGGSAVIAGCQLGTENEDIKRHIGVVWQGNVLDALLTVKENLLCRGSLYENNRQALRKKADSVLEILGLTDLVNKPYKQLSGGQKRRCEIAAALMHTPDILFLDEPTTGLDPATRKNVWQTIYSLQKELNMTVFLTTHYMEEAAKANHIAILEKGRLIQFGTPFSLKEQFAKDRLVLAFMPEQEKRLTEKIEQTGLPYKIKEGRLTVFVPDTLSAVPIINSVQDDVCGFEVIQGTMDDVFLNVTNADK